MTHWRTDQSHSVFGMFMGFNRGSQFSRVTAVHEPIYLSFIHQTDELLSSRMPAAEFCNVVYEIIEQNIFFQRNRSLCKVLYLILLNKWSLKFFIFMILLLPLGKGPKQILRVYWTICFLHLVSILRCLSCSNVVVIIFF